MASALWLWLLVVVALEKAVFLGLGAGEEVNVEAREVNAGGFRYYGGFPLRRDSINGAHPAPKVPRCLQERKPGICRAHVPRWHYDSAWGTCREFTYGGCQGNENNFRSEQHCRAACPDEIPCPTNPAKVCRVSESVCVSARCPQFPSAVCIVVPCSCQTTFVDERGMAVTCEGQKDTTTTTTSSTDANTTDSSSKPDVTTSSVPGDGGDGQRDDSVAVRNLVLVLLGMVGLGLIVFLVSAVVSKCRGGARRTESTTKLHECPKKDQINAAHHSSHVPIFDIL